jgi:hypothetical protein
MIQAYAFFVAFLAQILVVSVLQPAWLARYIRAKAAAQLPGLDPATRERFLGLYRLANAVIALIGLGLLGWLFSRMQSPDWDVAMVLKPSALYGTLQFLPFVAISLIAARYKKKALLATPLPGKRTASLERRGLFDMVPPLALFLSLLAYVLFAGFIFTVQRHPVPGFAGYAMLRTITLAYVVFGFAVYWLLYRRKKWPRETNAYRMQAMAVQVRLILSVSFAMIVFASLTAALRLLHLLTWVPFALSVYYVIVMLFLFMVMFTLRRQAEADVLAASPAS